MTFDILKKSGKNAPDFLMLENVDRLLKSPTKQRGRDFAVMLSSLNSLGYTVEWRVINAAEYGFPQRRRRVFILGYKKETKPYKELKKSEPNNWITKLGVITKGFPVEKNTDELNTFTLHEDPTVVSKEFSSNSPKVSPFENAGIMIDGTVHTKKVKPKYSGEQILLKDILIDDKNIPEEFFIKESDLERWKYLKGSKKEERTTKDGFKYWYSEDGMIFPDNVNAPSRTIVTGEGGSSPSRFKHVIKTKSGRLRRLTPIELERLNMFPDNHTEGVSDTKRAFLMGTHLLLESLRSLGNH